MHGLIDLLAQALEEHGFVCTRHAALEGRSGTVYTVPLLAESEERAVVLDVQSDDPLPAAAVADMEDVLHDVGGDCAVVCHTGAVEDHPATGVVLWDRERVVQIVGDAFVARALGTAPTPLTLHVTRPPLAQSLTELLPPAFLDAEPEQSFDLEALEHLGTGGRGPWSAGPEDPSAPAPVEPAAHSHALLPIRVTPDEARIHVRDRLAVRTVDALLQPVHLIEYECDLLVEGSLRYDTIHGRIQVHGTDKTVAEVDAEAVDPQGFTRLAELPSLAGQERALRVSAERARERATAHLLEAHTRLVDIEVDDPDYGYSYTEKKRVAPRPDHVRLHPLGIFHRVVWRLHGEAGHIDVDALSGEVLEEVLQHPRHDSLVID